MGLCCCFYLLHHPLSPSSHLLRSILLVRDLYEETGKSIPSIFSPWQLSAVNPRKPQSPAGLCLMVLGIENAVYSLSNISHRSMDSGIQLCVVLGRGKSYHCWHQDDKNSTKQHGRGVLRNGISSTRKYMVL